MVTFAEVPVGTVTEVTIAEVAVVTFAEVAVVTVAEVLVLNGASCRTTANPKMVWSYSLALSFLESGLQLLIVWYSRVQCMGLASIFCCMQCQKTIESFDDVIFTDEASVILDTHRKKCCKRLGEP